MDSASRTYAQIVLLIALAASFLRLTRAPRLAAALSQRMQHPRARTIQWIVSGTWLGASVFFAAIALVDAQRPWLWLAAAVAFLSGTQNALGVLVPERHKQAVIIRVYGGLFAALAVLIYLSIIRP